MTSTRVTDDLSLVTFLEEVKSFRIIEIKRTGLGRQVFTLDRDVTPELVEEYTASAWKQARDRYHAPGHQG